MAHDNSSIEARFAQLSSQVHRLEERLDELTAQIRVLQPEPSPQPAAHEPVSAAALPEFPANELSVPALFTGLAALCFIAVVALVLRTLTDNNVINQQAGTALGLVYCVFLLGQGHRRHVRQRPLAPLFTLSGAVLFFSIIIETHSRFHVLPALWAYLLLGALLGAAAFLGVRSNAWLMVYAGVLGACLTGLALDFPAPVFPLLGLLLLCGIAAACLSVSIRWCSGLRWILLALTLFFWLLWTVAGRFTLSRGLAPPVELGIPWVFPELAAFLLLLLTVTAAAVVRRDAAGFFEMIIPAIGAATVAAVAHLIVIPGSSAPGWYSAFGTSLAALPFAIAVTLVEKNGNGARIASGLIAAALVLLVFLPGCVPNLLPVFLCWALASAVLTIPPRLARNRSVMVLSHVFQGFVCLAACVFGILATNAAFPVDQAILAAVLGGLCLAQYARTREPLPGSHVPSFDAAALTAVVPLGAGLLYVFAIGRMLLFSAFTHFQWSEDAFQAAQSILISVAALSTAVLGLLWMHKQLLAVSIGIALMCAAKVFAYDLARLHGVPVVLSMLSFGVSLALGPSLWRRWQRLTSQSPPGSAGIPAG